MRSSRPGAITLVLLTGGLVGCTEPAGTLERCVGPELASAVLVLEADDNHTASGLGRIDTAGCFTETPGGVELGSDPVLAAAGGAYVLSRDLGTVHAIDPDALQIVATLPAADADSNLANVNPHDVGVDAAGNLWITRFGLGSVGIVDSSGVWSGEVDVSALADADGIPEMEAVRVVGDRVYVALEKIVPSFDTPPHVGLPGPSTIAVIDVETRELTDSFDLHGRNPFGRFVPVASDPALVSIAVPGDPYSISAEDGVERIDLAAMTSELVIDEEALGGSALEALLVSPTEGYAIVEGLPAGIDPTRVVAFNPSTGAVTWELAPADPANGAVHAGLAVAGDLLLVGDRTRGSARIRVFRRTDGKELDAIPVALMAPWSLLTLGG